MATRLMYLCEVCLDAGKETEATPVFLAVNDATAMVDLCAEHHLTHVGPVEQLIRDSGRPVEPDPKPGWVSRRTAVTGTHPCPGPGCVDKAPYGSSHNLSRHTVEVHGVSITTVYEAVRCCRVPGCEWRQSGAHQTMRGLGRHVSSHGMANVATMIYEVSLSDPEAIEDVLAVLWNGVPAPRPQQGVAF
jgi:hypothetical protein